MRFCFGGGTESACVLAFVAETRVSERDLAIGGRQLTRATRLGGLDGQA